MNYTVSVISQYLKRGKCLKSEKTLSDFEDESFLLCRLMITVLRHIWWDKQGYTATKRFTETIIEEDKVKKDKKQISIELSIIYVLLCIFRKGNESYGEFQ